MADSPFEIIGAGIAGLTTALALARNGFEVSIVDQAATLGEVGAGLQISPNASRVLIALGLGDALQRAISCPAQITLASGHSLQNIAHMPCGDFAARRWGAPYGVLHRADLQAMLLQAVEKEPRCQFELGRRVDMADLLRRRKTSGSPGVPFVIGADGVWSQARGLVAGAASLRFSGQVAWRFKVPSEQVVDLINPAHVTVLLAPNVHLVAYPLEDGKSINMVAITTGKDPGQTWVAHEDPQMRARLLQALGHCHPGIIAYLSQAPAMTRWPIFTMADGRWYDGIGTIVIGDAAHAMTPFAAQGAAMAIEDGYELARTLTTQDKDRHSALLRFESHRRKRIARTRNRAAFNQFAYHARGPIRLGRDIVLKLKSPESLASDLDWLYGYRSPGL